MSLCLPNPPARPSLARCVLRRMDYLALSVPEEVTDYTFAADQSALKVAGLRFCVVPMQSFEQSACFGSLCAIEACNVSQCVAAGRCLSENDHLRLSEGGSLHSVLDLDRPRVSLSNGRARRLRFCRYPDSPDRGMALSRSAAMSQSNSLKLPNKVCNYYLQ